MPVKGWASATTDDFEAVLCVAKFLFRLAGTSLVCFGPDLSSSDSRSVLSEFEHI